MAINSLNSVSHGLSGLVSGMDSQSMVDAMLAGTQAKIDKQKANKTILGYRRDTYRSTIKDLKSFQDTFFSFGSNSMLYSSFYNTMASTSKSNAFKVTAGSTAQTGKTTVNSVERLAQSLKLKSKLTKTTANVEGVLDLEKLKENGEIQLTLDGVTKTIKLPQSATEGVPLTEQEFVDKLNTSIKHEFGNGVTAELTGDKISFKPADNSREFSIMGNADAMGVLGIKTGTSNKMNTRMSLENINFDQKLMGTSFKFNINGVDFAVKDTDSLDSVISKINNSSANVKVRYSAIEDKFAIESTVSGEGSEITMSQSEGNLLTALFGIGTGGDVTGDTMYAYSSMNGKVPGIAEGADQEAIVKAIAEMNTALEAHIKSTDGSFNFIVDGKEIKVKVTEPPINGTSYTFEDVKAAVNSNTELDAKGIKLDLTVGSDGKFTGGVTLSVKDGVKVEMKDGMSKLGLSGSNQKVATKDTTLAQMGITKPVIIKIGSKELTFNPNNPKNTLAYMTTIMEKELETQSIAKGVIGEDGNPLTDKQIRDKISLQVLEAPPGSEGKIRLFGIDIPIDIAITGDDKKLFGTDTISLNSAGTALEEVAKGQNAVVYINGEKVVRSSNEFTVGGLSFELKETFYESYGADKEAAKTDPDVKVDTTKFETIDVSRDTDKIFNGVVKFMDEYNKLVDKTWALLKEDATYKDYPPLTDKQKESMSEKEVELWEKKSQEGLMRGDDTLEGIMDAMRQVLSYKPAGSKYSLADMGITTGYDMEKGIGGKLIFNDKNGTGDKLRDMISQEPEALEKLFTDSETGVLVQLNEVIIGATQGAKGKKYDKLSLVDLAGSSSADTSSKMYKEGREIDKNLENLKVKYEAEYARYWKQFNAMEQMIQQMNQQSSWLTQQMGG